MLTQFLIPVFNFMVFPPVFFYSKEPERKVEVAPEEEDNNPFAEDADETPSPSQEDSPRQMNGKEGVPVRALYDYTVTEEDELPLKAGEFLHKGCTKVPQSRETLTPRN